MAKFSAQVVRMQKASCGQQPAWIEEQTAQQADMHWTTVQSLKAFAQMRRQPVTHPLGLYVMPNGRITLNGMVMDQYEAVARLTLMVL